MSVTPTQLAAQPNMYPRRPTAPSVPRVFQVAVILYVLLTGELVRALQAALFGMQSGGEAAFTAAVVLAIAIDIVRITPLLVFARHPLGILHPLIITAVLWPLLVAMPTMIDELGGLGGLLLGEPVSPPYYMGLGWLPGPEIWRAIAWSNLCEMVALLSIYAGYGLVHDRAAIAAVRRPRREFDGKRIRMLAFGLIVFSIVVLLVLIQLRGGLSMHLADMARGRFRSMAGLGPLVAAVDIGPIALIVWIAARPRDVTQPLFIALLIVVAVAEFVSNGARSAAFAVFMMVGLAWALRTRRIPWRLAAILIPLFFIAFGAMNVVRTAGFAGQTSGEAIQGTGTEEFLARAQEEIEIRQSLQSTVPVIWEGHQVMNGPLWGSSYAAAVFAYVPRWIWPNKPRGPGSLYAQSFLGEVREGLAIPVSPTAEEYWNFGIIGVILISLLYGALIRRAHNFYVSRPENPFVVGAFVVFMTTFRPATDDLVALQQLALWLLLMVALALLFATKRRRTGIASPQFTYPVPATGPHAVG